MSEQSTIESNLPDSHPRRPGTVSRAVCSSIASFAVPAAILTAAFSEWPRDRVSFDETTTDAWTRSLYNLSTSLTSFAEETGASTAVVDRVGAGITLGAFTVALILSVATYGLRARVFTDFAESWRKFSLRLSRTVGPVLRWYVALLISTAVTAGGAGHSVAILTVQGAVSAIVWVLLLALCAYPSQAGSLFMQTITSIMRKVVLRAESRHIAT